MNPERVLHLNKIIFKQFLLCVLINHIIKTRTG